MVEFSNLTNKEYFKLNGKLSNQRTEKLIDLTDDLPSKLNEVLDSIAEGQSIQEGGIRYNDIEVQLSALHEILDGQEKEILSRIIYDFGELLDQESFDVEYNDNRLMEAASIINQILSL